MSSLTRSIRNARPPKAIVDPNRPYGWFVEQEPDDHGRLIDVATLLLTNAECPWTCVFCDLWKHTLDGPTPAGATPRQIAWALEQLPGTSWIKLYNSGNFFDPRAVPPDDHEKIAGLVEGFERVIVENHPSLTDDRIQPFRDLLQGRLEVALGLETVHPEVLPRLNKQLTVERYQRAADWLRGHDCDLRTFLLLRPPGLTEREGIDWALRSMEVAFAAGSTCCTIIPTRAGNGFLDGWQREGIFEPPTLHSLYEVLRRGLEMRQGRVFVDLWGVELHWPCPHCGPAQVQVLQRMNLEQQVLDWPPCQCPQG